MMLKPSSLIRDVEVLTVGELRKALTDCPDAMPVTDAVGDALRVMFYDDPAEGGKWLEAA